MKTHVNNRYNASKMLDKRSMSNQIDSPATHSSHATVTKPIKMVSSKVVVFPHHLHPRSNCITPRHNSTLQMIKNPKKTNQQPNITLNVGSLIMLGDNSGAKVKNYHRPLKVLTTPGSPKMIQYNTDQKPTRKGRIIQQQRAADFASSINNDDHHYKTLDE